MKKQSRNIQKTLLRTLRLNIQKSIIFGSYSNI